MRKMCECFLFLASNLSIVHFYWFIILINEIIDCPCGRKLPTGLETDEDNVTEAFNPIATNGEPFPWLNITLPTNLRPIRYMVTIHPNLTTLDVKGNSKIYSHSIIIQNSIKLTESPCRTSDNRSTNRKRH